LSFKKPKDYFQKEDGQKAPDKKELMR